VDVLVHDAGCASRVQFQTIALLLSRLDRALRARSPDPASINGKAGPKQIGHFGKHDLLILPREYQLAEVRLRSSRPGEFERPGLDRMQSGKTQQHDGYRRHSARIRHFNSPK
jgi:hypothetical protein